MNSVIRCALIAFMAFWMTLLTAFATIGVNAPYPGWLSVILGAELGAAVINGWVAFGWRISKLVRERREAREALRESRRHLAAATDRTIRRYVGMPQAVPFHVHDGERYALRAGDPGRCCLDGCRGSWDPPMPRYRYEMRPRICYQESESEPQVVEGVRLFSGHLTATEQTVRVLVCTAHGNEVPCPLCTPMDYYWRRP